jgi:spore coat protein CotF
MFDPELYRIFKKACNAGINFEKAVITNNRRRIYYWGRQVSELRKKHTKIFINKRNRNATPPHPSNN